MTVFSWKFRAAHGEFRQPLFITTNYHQLGVGSNLYGSLDPAMAGWGQFRLCLKRSILMRGVNLHVILSAAKNLNLLITGRFFSPLCGLQNDNEMKSVFSARA